MPVLLWVAIAVVLIGVYFAATGRGGELAYEHADHAPLNLGSVSGADVALLRPPTAMWGYNMQVTDAALDVIAQALRDRDVTIAHLQQQLTDLTYHAYGTTPAPVGAQDFRPRLGEDPLDVQPHPFPDRHEAHGPTPPEAWLPPAIEPKVADDQPNPVVWEAPLYTEAPQHQASSAPEEASPVPQDQASSAPEEASPVPQDQASSAPEEASPVPQHQAAPDPADQADPRAVGSASASAAPGLAPGAAPAPGPGADPAPTSGAPGPPGSSDATRGDATPGDPDTGGGDTLTAEEQGW